MALLQEIQVPLLAVNDTTLTVVEIGFASGDAVKKGDVLMVFETSKTTYDVEAEADGFVQYNCDVDTDYEVNAVVAMVYSDVAEVKKGGETKIKEVVAVSSVAPAVKVRAAEVFVSDGAAPVYNYSGETKFSQEALRLMAEKGVPPSQFAGWDLVTGRDVAGLGRKVETPVEKVVEKKKESVVVVNGDVIVKKLSSAKKREIEYLSDVQGSGVTSEIHVYVETEGIFTHIDRSLQYMKGSLLPVIVYEVSRLLASYPLLNGYYTGDAIAMYNEVAPGFAIDIDKGLKVLKIAGAGVKTVGEIENEILRLSGDYLDDKLDVADLTDITFTITDLSSEGVSFFRPLINKMNSSILGVSGIDEKLQRCALSLTFDHRVTEGKLAAQFLKELKERLESYRPKDLGSLKKNIECFKCYKSLREDLGGTGFARVVTPDGHDGYICQSCLKGF